MAPDKNVQFRESKKLLIESDKINYLIESDHLKLIDKVVHNAGS